MFVDAIQRPWQLGTLQLDFNMPRVFGLTYVGEDNKEHQPVMLHRAVLGSIERFIGVYLEHTGGHLPAWMSPVQVTVLNVTDRVNEYCEKILSFLKANGIRAEFDRRSEKLNYKIREAQLMKIPFMLIVGDKEAESNQVSLRLRSGEQKNALDLEKVLGQILNNIKDRSLNQDNF
jgi:threonyl-tRNA synthetase